MFDYIVNHAIKNVWCSPEQDTQFILEAYKITPHNGRRIAHKVMWRGTKLPDTTSRWHIYQIGGVHPLIFGLLPVRSKWTSFQTSCNEQKMICNIYIKEGIELARFDCYYMYNQDRNLVIAIRANNKIDFNFDNDKIYLRVYTNAYYNSIRADEALDYLEVKGSRISQLTDITDYQTWATSKEGKPGIVYYYINGYRYNQFNLLNAKVGDYVELIYDSSIYKVVDFKIGQLEVFQSILDSKQKYLLSYDDTDLKNIDYQDDIDVFIYDSKHAQQRGVYHHKNDPTVLRMVTHRDYSLNVSNLLTFIPTLQKAITDGRIIDPNECYVRIHIRKSGFNRPLIFENNRIHELYKLPYDLRFNAMVGTDSVVDVWKASELENSFYTALMRELRKNITNQKVENAYGYNGLAKVLGDTPQKTYLENGLKMSKVPYGLTQECTAYEYDATGTLLGFYPHLIGSDYTCFNNNCALVEMLYGIGSKVLDQVSGLDEVPVPTSGDYRVYYCNNISTGADNKWKDATGSDKYVIVNQKVKWANNTIDPFITVRTIKRFLAYDLEVDLIDTGGKLEFDIQYLDTSTTPHSLKPLTLPLGDLTIFLNGKSMIEGLDYFVQFPKLVICNKEYLINPHNQTQKIHIRMTGFCNKDITHARHTQMGFIEHGVMSNNYIYDVRDDKVLRITMNGNTYHRDDLIFSEEHSGVSITNAINGFPYLIKDIVVPTRNYTASNTYELRDKSIAIDKGVSDYLTLKIPQPPRAAPSAIVKRYRVHSPFICQIIFDLASGVLNIYDLGNLYNDSKVEERVAAYHYLIDFDPIHQDHLPDDNFVMIVPHFLDTVIDLDLFQYRFMFNLVRIYTKNKVPLNEYIRLKDIPPVS